MDGRASSRQLATRISDGEFGLSESSVEPVRAARAWAVRFSLRLAMATVLIVGILTIPVNCALAAGPHSIFINPAPVADANGVIHIAHHHPDTSPAGVPVLSSGEHYASQLPAPTTALSVLVAVTSPDTTLQLPHVPTAPSFTPEAPLERASAPAAPPPRA